MLGPGLLAFRHWASRLILLATAWLSIGMINTGLADSATGAVTCVQMPAGVVSCWRAEGNTSDSAGNNNGALSGDASFGAGVVGRSFVFDGNRDGIMVGTGTNLHLQNFTIEAWIKRASATTPSFNGNRNAEIFMLGNDASGVGFLIEATNNCLAIGKGGGIMGISDAEVADTNWHHVAVTKQDRQVVFYLDGKAGSPIEFDAGEFTFAAPAYIGGWWYGRDGVVDNSFYGSIDELTIYDRVLSHAEILAIFRAGGAGKCATTNPPPACITPPSGLLSWWRAEGHAFDSSGVNHGILINTAGYDAGKSGKGFAFDGRASGVSVGNAPGLRIQDFSIEAWIRRTSPSVPSYAENGVADVFSLGLVGGGYAFYLRPDGRLAFEKMLAKEVVSNVRITDTNWHHVVLTKSGSLLVFYLDAGAGQAVTNDFGGFVFAGGGHIGARLNRYSQIDNSFLGVIDELSFYDRALTPPEVLSQFNAGSAGKCVTDRPATIVVQPQDQTVTEGEEAIVAVGVNGSPPLAYQWQRYGENIAGATGLSLVLPSVGPLDQGDYSVLITNLAGSITSANVKLTVRTMSECALIRPGPVAWWNGENNLVDIVGGLAGTLTNKGAGFAPGKVGQALAFNGDQQVIWVPNCPAVNPTNALTLECWFYVEQHTRNDCVVFAAKDDPYAKPHVAPFILGLSQYTGKWVCSATVSGSRGKDDAPGVTEIAIRRWYHAAMTYDGVILRLYINGVMEGSKPIKAPMLLTDALFVIGGHSDGPWNFNGRVDELSLYHRALTPAEIRSIYLAGGAGKCPPSPALPLPLGLIGWWPGESDAVDSVSGCHGFAPDGTSHAPGKVGSAFSFQDMKQVVTITNVAPLAATNSLTLGCWVYVEQFPTNHSMPVVGRGDPLARRHQYRLSLVQVDGKWLPRAQLGLTGGEAVIDGTVAITPQTWHHVVMVYDGSALRFYLNGVLDGHTAAKGLIIAAEFPLRLGGDAADGLNLTGRLDEVALYNRALSSTEVAASYLAGRTGKSITDPRPSDRDLRKWLFNTR